MLFTFVTSVPIDVLISNYATELRIDGFYLLFNFVVYSLMTIVCISAVNFFNSENFRNKYPLRLITEFLFVIISVNIILYVCNYVLYKPVRIAEYFYSGIIRDKTLLGSYIQGTLVMIITEFIYQYDMRKKAEIEKERFRYMQLKAQLDPHFLFNCFNTISSMGYKGGVKESAVYTSSLADIYRYILNSKNEDEVTVKQEQDFILNYYGVLKQRYKEGLMLQVNISDKTQNKKMLFLTLQLLVENAVKHNAFNKDNPLKVLIYDSGDYIITENNINTKETDAYKKSGIGLKNLNQRYEMACKKGITVRKDETTFKVIVPLI